MTPNPGFCRSRIAATAPWILAAALAASPAAAQSLDGYVEFGTFRSSERTEEVGFEPIRSERSSRLLRANLNYLQRLFPQLQLQLGGFFEREWTDGETAGIPIDVVRRTFRPYARLKLDTPTVRAEIAYDRVDERAEFDNLAVREVRDSWSSILVWRPDPLNSAQIRYVHNEDRLTGIAEATRTSYTAAVDSFVRPTDWLTAQYRGNFDATDDKTLDTRIETDSHNVRLAYADEYWDQRVVVASDYSITRTSTWRESLVGGLVDVRLFPSAGLAAIDDAPEFDPLPPAPALIDANLTTGTAINLGLQPGDTRRRNLGLDLGIATRVNVLRVWVDREVRVEVARTFTWEIWFSDDNDRWILHRVLSSAPFGAFENFFELFFADVAARYVKVAVRPIDPTVPFASEYPLILVTELEGFERVNPPTNVAELARTNQRYSFNTRVRLLPDEQLFYDFSLIGTTVTGSGSRTGLTNGLSYSKAFTDVWSISARAADERAQDPSGDQRAEILSATLTANPLPTVSSSLFVGGRSETLYGEGRDSLSAVLTASATLYQGIDVNAGIGGSRTTTETDRTTDAALVNVGVQVTPHPSVTFGLTLQDTSRTESGGGLPEVEDPNRALEGSVTINPLPSLYLYANRREERRPTFAQFGTDRRTLDNYAVSWSPFPYGTLRFAFFWNETYDSSFNTVTTLWGPSLRWNIRPKWLLDVSYRETRNSSDLQNFDRDEFYATLRLGF